MLKGLKAVYVSSMLCLIVLVACATPYKQAEKNFWSLEEGGYEDEYLGDDTYLITISVNSFTEKATAYSYFHRRAQELTGQKGYDRYEVLDSDRPDEHSIVFIDKTPLFFTKPRVQGRIKCYKNSPSASTSPPSNEVQAAATVSIGTAWPVKEGYVVTNYHVVEGRSSFLLMREDGSSFAASVALVDQANDLALLQVDDPSLLPPAIPLSETPAPLGSEVFTIGFPRIDEMGSSPKLATGRIAGERGYRDDIRHYQISTELLGGNSGGPLLDLNGKAVGIVVSKYIDASSVSYAIKIPYLAMLLENVPSKRVLAGIRTPGGSIVELAELFTPSILLVRASDGIPLRNEPTAVVQDRVPETVGRIDMADIRKLGQRKTYTSQELSQKQLSILRSRFNLEDFQTFRWGRTSAPKGHAHYGLEFFAIRVSKSPSITRVFYVDGTGRIVDSK